MNSATIENLKEANRHLLIFRLKTQYFNNPIRLGINSSDQINLHIALETCDNYNDFLDLVDLL